MISPSSPSVQVTSVTCAPSAAYRAIVAPVPIDSSSGCACTSSSAGLARAHGGEPTGRGTILPGRQDASMTETFPRQEARTRRFTLGVPRAFRVSPDGARVAYLRTRGGGDPVTCLWVLDVGPGTERLVADPRTLGGDEQDLPPEERARRERVREQAGGIVAYATDADLTVAVFSWSGRVFAADLAARRGAARGGGARPGAGSAPRPDRETAGLRPGGRAAGGQPGRPGRRPGAGRRAAPRRDVRAGRVHRGRGDGPVPRLLVVPGRLGAAGGAGGRDAGEPVAHRRPGQPGPPARRGGLPGRRHPERRGVRSLLASLDGTTVVESRPTAARSPTWSTAHWTGAARPAGAGAEPGPAHDAAAVRRRRDRPGRGTARGRRPALAGDRPRRPGVDRGRPAGVDRRPGGRPPPAGRRARSAGRGRTGDPARPAGARRARRRRRHRAVPGVRGADRGPALGVWPRRAQPGQRAPGRGRAGRRDRHPRGRDHGGVPPRAGRRRRDGPGVPGRRARWPSIASLAETPGARRAAAGAVRRRAAARSAPRCCSRPGTSPAGGSCRCCSTRTAARTRSGCCRPAPPT